MLSIRDPDSLYQLKIEAGDVGIAGFVTCTASGCFSPRFGSVQLHS